MFNLIQNHRDQGSKVVPEVILQQTIGREPYNCFQTEATFKDSKRAIIMTPWISIALHLGAKDCGE